MIWRLFRLLAEHRQRRARIRGANGVEAWRELLRIDDEPGLLHPKGHELAGRTRRARRMRMEFMEAHQRLTIARPRRAAVYDLPQVRSG